MNEFVSALYLGIRHSQGELAEWESLTTGMPAVLGTPPAYHRVAQSLAELQGCERGVLGRSTLHLMWDLFTMYGRADTSLYLDASAYPISQWGVQHAACRGSQVQHFPHHDADVLERLLRRDTQRRRRPILVTDGWCVRCGRLAPLDAYLALAQRHMGLLIVDDTQALGVLGERRPGTHTPYGAGGGGSLRWFGIKDSHVILVASLAKAFGAPLALLSSSNQFVRKFETASDTRVHSSPPSMADVRAAEHALAVNASRGESLRQRLARTVRRFRKGLMHLGFSARNSLFPVQVFQPPSGVNIGEVHSCLAGQGVHVLRLRRDRHHHEGLAAVINAGHHPRDIDAAIRALKHCLCGPFTSCKIKEPVHGMPL